jgi:hypothetical protein
MGSHAREEGTLRIRRNGSPHTVRFKQRFSEPPQIEFARESKPRGKPLIAGTLELVDIRADHFVVSLKSPLGGYGELDWTVAGSRPDSTYRTLKFLGAIVGLVAGGLSIYVALVNFGLVPNLFER